MPADLNIFVSSTSPALEYTLNFIFSAYLGLDYQLRVGEDLEIESIQSIGYGVAIDNGVNLGSNGYLFQDDFLNHPEVSETFWENLPVFFPIQEGDLPFDLFSAIFFLLARVEEYLPYKPDKHGRFSLNESIFKNSEILKRPIVDEWLTQFEAILKTTYPYLKTRKRQFQWINTFDIDVAFAYKGRPSYRIFGGIVKDILSSDWSRINQRVRVLLLGGKDPFDTYDFQRISSKYADEVHHFFLVGGETQFDNNLSLENRRMQNLISTTSRFSEVGLHPSYETLESMEILQAEKYHLEYKLKELVSSSRQHFLRVKLPETYRNLANSGMDRDYSMGFAECAGFRSGTTHEHLFFDVLLQKSLPIKIVPLHAMDGTFRDYLNISPQEATSILTELIDSIYSVKGNFVSLWHNDLLAEDAENQWREVYEKMVEHISNLKSQK